MARWRNRTAGLGLGLVLAVAGMAGCGGSSSDSSTSTDGGFSGLVRKPPKPAPPLARRTRSAIRELTSIKGKAVLVTFIYSHCPDICPLIVSHLKTAQAELGPKAKDLQIIAVSTDPQGRHAEDREAFLEQHGMTGKMEYLIGTGRTRDGLDRLEHRRQGPTRQDRDLVEHSALVYGISANGNVTTLYPANFKPAQIVHDVPLLESA